MAKRRHHLGTIDIKVTRKDRKNDEPIGDLKLEDLEFTIDEKAVAAINEDFDNLHRNIRDENIREVSARKIKNSVITSVAIATDVTIIPHTLGIVPHDYRVTPLGSDTAWYQSKAPDANNVYLVAPTAMTANIIVEG